MTQVFDQLIPEEISRRAAKISLILMDVDGVLTNGTVYFVPASDGQLVETKGCHSHDGLALHWCATNDILTGVISGRNSPAFAEWARSLMVTYVVQGHLAKEVAFNEILSQAHVIEDQVAFIGDDFTDAPLMRRVGLAVAVENARPEVKSIAHLVTSAGGGHGALREVVEVILKAKGLWSALLERYSL